MMESQDETLQYVLLALEDQAWRALSQGTGAAFYERNLAPQALMVFPFGVLTREESIAAMKVAPPWASFRLEEPRVVVLTEESALLTYRATAQRAGQEPYAARMTTVFVKHEGPGTRRSISRRR
jgi:hypothetical protein